MVQSKVRIRVRAGFTLMEVLVVMAILVVLAGTGGVFYMKYLEDAKKDAAQIGVANLDQAVNAYKTNQRISGGDYPASVEELTRPSADGSPAALEVKALIDPWGRPYVYERENRNPLTGKPHIYSNGPNPGNPAGRISNWGPGQ